LNDAEAEGVEQAEQEEASPQALHPADRCERTTERMANAIATRRIRDMTIVAITFHPTFRQAE
jgi:hypothetical protein